ncbi:nuclear transport factor 2 family protein [Novosphingobium album (ex Liu et al. 2023)]|uniref:Nuclear transport factor 2 family protein n=1 Tax=Novosphingobium album (ex Liu et al. 2023) TaxID=3031130 RepID=A0ABT5WVW3_9SPHN|nr:nuclear transport factor 2 family protein [Novosphingobium album (ex Liu et al. 2023)]MDE8654006.1 nuclear transport factor 2 family protein [Novosphingobium album (ex Liu et al. 2023)]
MSDTLAQLADKQAITELIYTYCRAVDRLDVPLGHSVWHEDGYADYGAAYYRGPGRGVIDLICQHHLGLLSHSHQVANVLIALDGDDAGSEAYVTGTMRAERDGKLFQIGVWGRYLDRWQKRGGRWGLLHRVVVFEHQEMRETTDLPSHGVPSSRDRDDPSYAILAKWP